MNHEKQKEIVSETDELDAKMKEEDGLSIIKPPDEMLGKYYRRAIATFTKEELIILQNFGDLIGIDPTFCCLKSNWSIIPLTVVGNDRQILSGGCIFCSNVTNDVFCWILKMLTYDLPCSSIIKTICSDDDLALDSAFTKMILDPSISCLKRIICIWHKFQKFKEIVNKLQMTAEEKNDILLKFKLMYSTRNEEKCIFLK